MQKIYFILILLFAGAGATAQDTITIQDPQLSFSYERPTGWLSTDDELYHYITKISGDSIAGFSPNVAITYYDGRCQDLDVCYDGEVNAGLPYAYDNFKILNQGEETIDGVRAKWVHFSGKKKAGKIPVISYIYYFIRHNQLFVIQTRATENDNPEKELLKIVRSFNTLISNDIRKN